MVAVVALVGLKVLMMVSSTNYGLSLLPDQPEDLSLVPDQRHSHVSLRRWGTNKQKRGV